MEYLIYDDWIAFEQCNSYNQWGNLKFAIKSAGVEWRLPSLEWEFDEEELRTLKRFCDEQWTAVELVNHAVYQCGYGGRIARPFYNGTLKTHKWSKMKQFGLADGIELPEIDPN